MKLKRFLPLRREFTILATHNAILQKAISNDAVIINSPVAGEVDRQHQFRQSTSVGGIRRLPCRCGFYVKILQNITILLFRPPALYSLRSVW
jgi:hypothetical protein